ncbi:hypothetical protein LTR50_007042 [Elasticomyces elasticus]|nr:hypothetical protein LTR50_007042 [Elasticomyces elasticus]
MSRPIKPRSSSSKSLEASHRSEHFYSSSPIAEESIARDLEDDPDEDSTTGDTEEELNTLTTTISQQQQQFSGYSMASSYRRPSYIASGPRTLFPNIPPTDSRHVLTDQEQEAMLNEERSLLRDNQLIPPKHPRRGSQASSRSGGRSGSHSGKRLSLPSFVPRNKSTPSDEESAVVSDSIEPSETTTLLGESADQPYGGEDTPENINKKWEEAVMSGKIQTTWQREAKVLARYSRSLIVTFLLQYSLTVASIFTVGHIGKAELGAVSLASMTANITGYAIYQGLATSLDTLCSQAYGSGRKTLVGLQLQRMVYFLWAITIPVAIVWAAGTRILEAIVPEKETAALAGLYLKVLIAGAPGYAAFESGKRFLQAQGLFQATLYVLLFCAPLNAFMHWLFVWQFKWGFIGAPIAVAITENLLPLCLFLYVRFVAGSECWGGFSRKAFKNWGPMIRLALPGLVMVLAEFLAFEILTLSASWISSTHLAAQSVLSTLASITFFQLPFPVSIAASTRIANLIGATLGDAAKLSAKVTLVIAAIAGCFNMILLSSVRSYIPQLFTSDPDVIELVRGVLPICAAFQLFDALAANCNGILRGLGRQEVGGYVNLFSYYVIAMPISFGTGFGLHWDLYGLWAGPALALGIVAAIEGWFIYKTNWQDAVDAANKRNTQG